MPARRSAKNSPPEKAENYLQFAWHIAFDTTTAAVRQAGSQLGYGSFEKIMGLGGSEITISYASGSITVLQKPSATSGSEVRRFTYTITSNRIDKIDIEEYAIPPGESTPSWVLYRKIDFTYHENISGAVEGSSGDLIGIKEETLLSPASTWFERKWVFRYYTGSYNSSTNPGYPYQVKAILDPQSVHEWELANPSLPVTDIFKKTAAQLASYVDRQYEYASDKRVRQIDFKSGGWPSRISSWDNDLR